MTRVMITNGNNVHAPDYHAEVTAEKIISVAETASPETVLAARDLRKKVEVILTSHHQVTHDTEQAALATMGPARYSHPLESVVDEGVMKQIVAASVGTILEGHFARADVQELILAELHHETRSQMNVHRLVHKEASRLSTLT
jgi:hypothetical protein